MLSKVLLTPVDSLVELIKKNNNCSTKFLETELKLPSEYIEKWLVILEENKVVKVHYKGFEGFVNYIEEDEGEDKKILDVEKIKKVFIEKAKGKHLSYEKMKKVWPYFLKEHEEEIKKLFENKARSMGYEENKVNTGWIKYRGDLEKL